MGFGPSRPIKANDAWKYAIPFGTPPKYPSMIGMGQDGIKRHMSMSRPAGLPAFWRPIKTTISND